MKAAGSGRDEDVACSVAVLDEDVACSVAVLFSRKPVARSNAFAAAMNDQGGGLLDVRADTLLTESAHVSSKRMRMFRNQTNASEG